MESWTLSTVTSCPRLRRPVLSLRTTPSRPPTSAGAIACTIFKTTRPEATENTRGAYHISAIPNATLDGLGGQPENVIFLTCDAFGVLPPISRLTPEQAKYHFISGYTARVAGTEKGVTEPSPVFSACYGAPFMPLHPRRYQWVF